MGEMAKDDDVKMEQAEITMDVPLVIAVSWEYPQSALVRDADVINVEHFNCSLREKYDKLNVDAMMGIEETWKNVMKETVNEIEGKYQDDIVGFVNFIHQRLQRHSETDIA